MTVRKLHGQVGGSVSAGSLFEERERVAIVGDGLRVIASEVKNLGADRVCNSLHEGAWAVAPGQDVDCESIHLERLMEVTHQSCKGGFRRVERRRIGVGDL